MSTYSITAQNGRADYLFALCNGGTIRLYDGTVPLNARASLSGNTLLCQGTMSNPAWPAAGGANGGSATSNAITGGNAVANGTPTFCRIYDSGGTNCVMQLLVGSEVTVSPAAITSGVAVSYSPATHAENN